MSMPVTDPNEAPVQRTHEQIARRIEAIAPDDFFGFQTSDLLAFLPWHMAKPFLKDGANESEWRAKYPVFKPPLKVAKEYLPFAWDKANNCRGISAFRSLEHFRALLWLGGFSSHTIDVVFENYEWFGKGQLVFVSQVVGLTNWRALDDLKWRNAQDAEHMPYDQRAKELVKWLSLADLAASSKHLPEAVTP